ncbi:MAG: uncharacterized protein H6Q89_3828 [Myxococcaceae bacterium]|nr:uncharacterized protein [Myxococcaceae bacterium]
MRESQTAGFGAKCAIHPDRTATRTCGRCGNFTCDECNGGGSEPMCPACRSLTGTEAFPFTRDSYSFDGIWNYAFEKWKQEWVMLSVAVLILMAVGFVAVLFNSVFQAIAKGIVGERAGTVGIVAVTVISSVMSQIVSMIVQGAFQMGLIRILIDVLNGKKADVGRIMTQLPKLGRYILQVILIQLMVLLPVLLYMGALLVVAAAVSGLSFGDLDHWGRALRGPGAGILVLGGLALIPVLYYVSLPLVFANMELVYGDSSPVESIRRAYVIAKGHRLSILGFGFIGGLVFLVGFVACCVGIIPAWGLAYLLLTGLYLALRNGSGLPPPVET